ncbi:MAG: TolC family protein [Omnitrophica bacterium]|nr:TolC family protein [Candidatus Omnitrophota bacterium]
MAKRTLLLIPLILCLISPEAFTFAREKIELSLSDCLNIGLGHNLDIKIAKIESRLKGEDVTLARSIFDSTITGKVAYTDDQRAQASTIFGTQSITTEYEFGVETKLPLGTEIEIDYFDNREWTDSAFAVQNPLHRAELALTLRQPILKNSFGYVDRNNVKFSKIEAETAGIKALDRVEEAIADIEKAYWNLAFHYNNVGLRKKLLIDAGELYDIFKKHFKTGLAESTEVYEVESNMRIRKAELAIAENDLESASNSLKLLLNEGDNFIIIPKNKLMALGYRANLADSLKEAFTANRDYRIKKNELEAKKITLKMKENELWPEVDLVGTLAINGVHGKFTKANRRLTTNKHSEYYGGIEISIPLENRAARGAYNKADLEKEKAVLELIKIEKEIAVNVDRDVRDVNLSHENAFRWAKIKDLQYQKFKDEEKKLKYGRSNSKTVIDYQNDLTRAALSEYSAMLEYYSAMVDLENEKDTLLFTVGVLAK